MGVYQLLGDMLQGLNSDKITLSKCYYVVHYLVFKFKVASGNCHLANLRVSFTACSSTMQLRCVIQKTFHRDSSAQVREVLKRIPKETIHLNYVET